MGSPGGRCGTLARTVPVSSVPAVRWASGAQWSPERRAMSRRPSASPSSSQSIPDTRKESTPACCLGSLLRNTSTPGSWARASPIWTVRAAHGCRWTVPPAFPRSAVPPAARRSRRCCGSPPPDGRAGSPASPAGWIRSLPPLQQRWRGLSAEQKTGPLGAVQPLVARHGDEGCPQFLQMDREAAR